MFSLVNQVSRMSIREGDFFLQCCSMNFSCTVYISQQLVDEISWKVSQILINNITVNRLHLIQFFVCG